MGRRLSIGIAPIQCAAVLSILSVLALNPPIEGAMLAIPLERSSQGVLANVALKEGASLLGAGPFAGSLIVYGRRYQLQPAFWRVGAVLIAAPAPLCGNVRLPANRAAAQ